VSLIYKTRISIVVCQVETERGHDCCQIGERVSGQRLYRGRHPTIREGLGQRHAPQRAAIADIHAAEREVPVGAFKEDGDALASEGMKGVRDDQRIRAATVR
jgi:hypothetical protein